MNAKVAGRLLVTVFVTSAGCGSSRGGSRDGAVDIGTGIDTGADTPNLPPTTALRLIAPLSTATVTSRRPTLHWVLDRACDSAHVQICRDRTCTKEVTAFDTSGSSGVPGSDLPTGVLFWHAYGLSAGSIIEGWTPTWEFTVGKLSAPVDTSWGTTPDVNGDGYADVLIAAPDAGTVSVYLGAVHRG